MLVKLFNYMLICGTVPTVFGSGFSVPIPKIFMTSLRMTSEAFRCITISPVISKLFEHCVLGNFGIYFSSCDSQFGFKKRTGCNHAIFSVKCVVDYFVKGGSTVNVCTLNISKAFDNISHSILFIKLMKRGIPKSLLTLLINWYSSSQSRVRWLNAYSYSYFPTVGVRQGGVLSPLLFAVYVNDLLLNLQSSRLGCVINGMSVNSFMYADDLILLSLSVIDLQKMIDFCSFELGRIKLNINSSKSVCLRIGKRYAFNCAKLYVNGIVLSFTNEIKYLGVFIKSGTIFKFNTDVNKSKCYRIMNSILSKCRNKPELVIPLCDAYCFPVLFYGSEAMMLNNSQKISLDSTVKNLFYKLFNSNDAHVIKQCQYHMSCLPTSYAIDLRSVKFYAKMKNSENVILRSFFEKCGNTYLHDLSVKYGLLNCRASDFTDCMWSHFINSL